MEEVKLFDAEYRLMEIIWDNEPINSTQLVKIANKKLDWKKSTTYTVVRKLSDRKIIENKYATIKSLVDKESVLMSESKEFLDKMYKGSLKMFLVGFLNNNGISEEEAKELKKIINENIDKEV